ncbi:cation:proton antiporter [Streptomyces pseudovenezuelae]|uniref:cation:proton antiporter domain-containing protein n=1 Tax=Streptomyces pseudovenezuelae TaxID=67350 RepID=UPI0034A58BCE
MTDRRPWVPFFFGNAVVLAVGEGIGWPTIVLCAAALTVVRILPVMLAFLGSTFTWRERLMVGALGPRGTTCLVFGLLAFNALGRGFGRFIGDSRLSGNGCSRSGCRNTTFAVRGRC